MKNDGSYFLHFRNIDGVDGDFKPELVYPFVWQGVQFFVHRPYRSGISLFDSEFWEVSERSTGYALGDKNIKTIAEAKRIAIAKLDKVGIEKVKEIIVKVKEDKV